MSSDSPSAHSESPRRDLHVCICDDCSPALDFVRHCQHEAENRRLREALLEYGNHSKTCSEVRGYACNCGWHAIQVEVEQSG